MQRFYHSFFLAIPSVQFWKREKLSRACLRGRPIANRSAGLKGEESREGLSVGHNMSLTARLSLVGLQESDPEDFLAGSLGVIFPDDVTNRRFPLFSSEFWPQVVCLTYTHCASLAVRTAL
jgi:hypothetical protein